MQKDASISNSEVRDYRRMLKITPIRPKHKAIKPYVLILFFVLKVVYIYRSDCDYDDVFLRWKYSIEGSIIWIKNLKVRISAILSYFQPLPLQPQESLTTRFEITPVMIGQLLPVYWFTLAILTIPIAGIKRNSVLRFLLNTELQFNYIQVPTRLYP